MQKQTSVFQDPGPTFNLNLQHSFSFLTIKYAHLFHPQFSMRYTELIYFLVFRQGWQCYINQISSFILWKMKKSILLCIWFFSPIKRLPLRKIAVPSIWSTFNQSVTCMQTLSEVQYARSKLGPRDKILHLSKDSKSSVFQITVKCFPEHKSWEQIIFQNKTEIVIQIHQTMCTVHHIMICLIDTSGYR